MVSYIYFPNQTKQQVIFINRINTHIGSQYHISNTCGGQLPNAKVLAHAFDRNHYAYQYDNGSADAIDAFIAQFDEIGGAGKTINTIIEESFRNFLQHILYKQNMNQTYMQSIF